MDIFWAELAAGVLTAVFLAACGFFWRLSKTMSRIDTWIESTDAYKDELRRKADLLEKRVDVHDVLWSTNYLRSINSEMIVNGDMDLPGRTPKERR